MPDAPWRQGLARAARNGQSRGVMRRPFIEGLVAAAACATVSGAGASVTTRIDVSDFRVALATLVPGATGAVAFASATGSTSESDSSFGDPSTDQHCWFSSGLAF